MNKDVIVIGGGIIGCAIAYSLQKRGKSVALLERSNLVAGASGSCDQGILLQSKAPNEHLLLGIRAMEMYKELGRELGRDLEFTQKGYMLLMESELECRVMDGIIEKQRALGLPVARGVEDALNGVIRPVHLCADDDIFQNGHFIEQAQVLIGAHDAGLRDSIRACAGDVGALKPDRAGRRRQNAGEHIDDGGLAGAVRTDQTVDPALLQR